jgi:hypothetical protein
MTSESYAWFTPVWLVMQKSTYYDIGSSKIEELYWQIQFWVLQTFWIKWTVPLYTGKYDKLGPQMANWQLDAIIELLQKCYYKAIESPNTLSGWQMSHSVNMPLATRYSHFADNEYRRQFDAAESSKETNNMPSAPRIASK